MQNSAAADLTLYALCGAHGIPLLSWLRIAGEARRGKARRGIAGKAGQGKARLGEASQAGLGLAGRGGAWQGIAGMARHSEAGPGRATQKPDDGSGV
jgi:hypothetical protein